MKKSVAILCFILSVISFPLVAFADVKLPAVVSSNMVLQRNTTITIWGWADADEEITISTSWNKNVRTLKADPKGNWRIEIATTNSQEPQEMNIKSKTTVINLENILFGEVWLCSGQSNMFQSVKGYLGQPTYGSTMAIAKSSNPNLRLFTADREGSKVPLNDLREYSSWQQASPENVAQFSAIGYFFAEQLQDILDVPVGIIHTSWGASTVQAWMSKEAMSAFEEVVINDQDFLNRPNRTPTALFNAMINPIIPYTIKGVLWYQGESNRNEPDKYKELFPAMVKDWRTRWGLGDFPFYFAQIAPYTYDDKNAFETYKNTAFIREAQLQCLDLIPNSGIAITMDIGESDFIHPPKKKEVADRLLFNALNKTYGFKNIDYTSPIYDSFIKEDDSLIISFKNAEAGLYTYRKLEDFEIAGEDRIFYPAAAKIVNGKNISVRSEAVSQPVAVRYAWKNWVVGTLYGANLLPASSFRTDNWSDSKRSEQ